jgi:hypothetical protein
VKGRNRIVCRRPDGNWVQRRFDADRASSVHPAQGEAQQVALTQLHRSGGGELITKLEGGQIRAKDTVRPRHDEYPPEG